VPGCGPFIETWFHQDYGSMSKPEDVKSWSAEHKLLHYSHHEYQANGSTIPYISLETGVWEYTFDGTQGPAWTQVDPSAPTCTQTICRRTYLTRSYDDAAATGSPIAFGLVTQELFYGDYELAGDERTVRTQYRPNTDLYIVAAPASIDTYGGGQLLAQALNYFDGAGDWSTPPTRGNMTEQRKWLSTTNSYVSEQKTYDLDNGNVLSTTDANGVVSTVSYDDTYALFATTTTHAAGRPEQQITMATWDPVCSVQTRVVQLQGALPAPTDPTSTMGYDELCRPVTADTPLGGFTRNYYVSLGNPNGQFVETQSPAADGSGPLFSRVFFDGMGRTYREIHKGPNSGAPLVARDFAYDARGNAKTSTAPFYVNGGGGALEEVQVTIMRYDAVGRVLKLIHPDNSAVHSAYGARSVTVIDELGHSQTDTNDAYGRRTQHDEVDQEGTHSSTYVYDVRGDLVDTFDPAGNHTHYEYDSLGRRTLMDDLDRGRWTYEYDAIGNSTAFTDALGQRTTLTYDALNRKLTKTANPLGDASVTVTWTYDEPRDGFFNKGHMTSSADPSGSASYNYDQAGREVDKTRTVDNVPYEVTRGYDAGGRVKWTHFWFENDDIGTPSDPLQYDGAGRLVQIPGIVNGASYDASGQLLSRTNANGTLTTKSYDPKRKWLTSIHTAGSAVLQQLEYARDFEGKIASVTSNIGTESWNYAYDALHRLTSATNLGDASFSQQFHYDPTGNMTWNSLVGDYSYPATGSPHPHAVTTAGSQSYSYDANGNLISGGCRTLTYDGDNRLTRVDMGACSPAVMGRVPGQSAPVRAGDPPGANEGASARQSPGDSDRAPPGVEGRPSGTAAPPPGSAAANRNVEAVPATQSVPRGETCDASAGDDAVEGGR
jgi:YD repeat-containing protein